MLKIVTTSFVISMYISLAVVICDYIPLIVFQDFTMYGKVKQKCLEFVLQTIFFYNDQERFFVFKDANICAQQCTRKNFFFS